MEKHDWVWEQVFEVDVNDLVKVCSAANSIAQDQAAADEDTLTDFMYTTPEAWEPALRQLLTLTRVHVCPPTAVAKGHSGLADKASAKLHSHYMELRDRDALLTHLRSFRAHTTDMGTELGLADMLVQDARLLIPHWFAGAQGHDGDLVADIELADNGDDAEVDACQASPDSPELQADVEVESCGIEAAAADDAIAEGVSAAEAPAAAAAAPEVPEAPQAQTVWGHMLMPFAHAIPGMQHVLDNMTKEIAEHLDGVRRLQELTVAVRVFAVQA